jgi:hypothetical protein
MEKSVNKRLGCFWSRNIKKYSFAFSTLGTSLVFKSVILSIDIALIVNTSYDYNTLCIPGMGIH